MNFDTFKALHIIFVVSWFAGLFYIVRLFVYHVEANAKTEMEQSILKPQYELMQRRLWWIITTPAMILTVVFGALMLVSRPAYLQMDWMHLKLTFVLLLIGYHFICQRLMFKLRDGECKWKSNQFRLWNEVATLILVAVVFLVVLKNSLSWISGTLGFFGVAIALMIGIKFYKRVRKN